MSEIINRPSGKNGAYISIRFLMLIGLSLALYAAQPRTITSFASVQDIAIPAIIGLIGIALVGIIAFIKPIERYTFVVILVADWALVAAYTYFSIAANPLLTLGIAGAVIVSGTLRLGMELGAVQAVGAFIVMVLTLALSPELGFDALLNNSLTYAPGLLIAVVLAVVAALWSNALNEENSVGRKVVRDEINEARTRLENMQERAKAFSELAARLNETLDYDHIIDAALDVGRLSIRDDARQRTLSLAIMVVGEDEMEIASARGLQEADTFHIFRGKAGIIAQAINEGRAVIKNSGSADPELKKINAFQGIQSTLCIPLRAHYETYGVLVFGSTAPNAIHEDHIDTLEAIGVQTTLALGNAELFEDLRLEKERIVQIEENGRRSLVRDLHDIPTQTVSAVAMHLSTLPMMVEKNPDKLREEVDNIRKMALRATEEIRHVMFTLRPLALEHQGLTAALEQLAEKMQKTYKQPMQVNFDKRAEHRLKPDAHGTLFYLIEEAANNARKYAKASMIQVKGTLEGRRVVVRIRDNGKGFDTNAVDANYENRGSFGMVNMRERAELINATFELESTPGKGTQVTVRVPIELEETQPIPNEVPTDPPAAPRKSFKKKQKQYSGPLSPST